MDPIVAVAVVIALAVVGVVVWVLMQRRRSEELRARYGPEYDRTVREAGDQRRAEAELLRRQERVEHLDIRPLSAAHRERFGGEWRAVQARFVDEPKGAVTAADGLVEEVMRLRGYPVADFDQRAADLSVHHPRVADNYRAARDVALRHRRGEASTEDLRQAMVFYRELFEDLLGDGSAEEEARSASHPHVADREVARAVARDDRVVAEPPAARVPRERDERMIDERMIDERTMRDDREV